MGKPSRQGQTCLGQGLGRFAVIPIQFAAWKLGLEEGLARALLRIMGTRAGYACLEGMHLPGYLIINSISRAVVLATVVIGTR